jgi:hypothetical protein
MALTDRDTLNIQDLYGKYLQFTSIMLEDYKMIEIAGVMMTQALSLYRTSLTEEDYQLMVKSMYDRRDEVRTFK